MADDAATIAQLQAELVAARQREAVLAARLTVSAEHQTATAETLHVLTSSPLNLHDVLRAIVESAIHVSRSAGAALWIVEGQSLRAVTRIGITSGQSEIGTVISLSARDGGTAAVRERRTIHIPDRSDSALWVTFPDTPADSRSGVSTINVPLVYKQRALGLIQANREIVDPFTPQEIALLETFADQAVIAIENARLFDELERRNAELQESNRQVTESLEQQTATAEVLRVIASSPTDIGPVLEAIGRSAMQLCDSTKFSLLLRENDHLVRRAVWNVQGAGELGERFPLTVRMDIAKVVLERCTVHIPDRSDPSVLVEFPDSQIRLAISTVTVPLLREHEAIGTMSVARDVVSPYSSRDIALLETFADQAVIAIENARLFADLQENLEQQTATGEILRVIASSPTDVQPVLDTIVASAKRLTEASEALLWRVDGDNLRGAAHSDPTAPTDAPEGLLASTRPIDPSSPGGQAALRRETIRVDDMAALGMSLHPETRAAQRRLGFRSQVATPLVREGEAIGVLVVNRMQVRPFSDEHVALLESFAHQAVIAIENARLFSELEQRNTELQESNRQVNEALEQQTATGEILRIIASSPTDAQPVPRSHRQKRESIE